MSKILLEQFEGPLDLLLKLIEEDKLQITEISLAHITDQYLNYIEDNDNLIPEEVADFLLIASKLIYLKSKHLLPDFNLEDKDDASSLETQLKIYRKYYNASKNISKMLGNKNFLYVRINTYKLKKISGFISPKKVNNNIIKDTFNIILNRLEKIIELPNIIMVKTISIAERINDIKILIKNINNISFEDILGKKDNKVEVVVSFLAILELVKQREVVIKQNKLFGDLNIINNKEINF